MKVAIVGAGVAGLAIGWRLAQKGCAVEVFERGLAGRGATWASAGMIAALAETGIDDSPHSRFAEDARRMWPAFARELEETSGQHLRMRKDGAVLVAFDEQQETKLLGLADACRKKEIPATWMTANEACALEPMLAPNLRGALHASDSGQVDNRVLGDALAVSLRRAGGILHEQCQAQLIVVEKERARGLVTEDAIIVADVVVIAGGAWSNWIGGIPNGVLPRVRPVKGQMVALRPPSGETPPKYAACESDVYIVPRADRVLLGATVEEAGYDTSVSKEARDWLVAEATKLMPSLSHWSKSESWSGLRPAAPDGLPVLGPTGMDGLFVASGQFRNGILFAPVVAEAMQAIVLGREPLPYLSAFDPCRFASRRN